jgi:hypothetical protein
MIPGDLAAVADRMPHDVLGGAEGRPPLEQLAVGDRLAVPAGTEPVDMHEPHAALLLAGHVARGDLGAVRRMVHGLEHDLGPWSVNPWRFVEHLAELLVRRAQPTAENEAEPAETAEP